MTDPGHYTLISTMYIIFRVGEHVLGHRITVRGTGVLSWELPMFALPTAADIERPDIIGLVRTTVGEHLDIGVIFQKLLSRVPASTLLRKVIHGTTVSAAD
jgi:hypothetical protein